MMGLVGVRIVRGSLLRGAIVANEGTRARWSEDKWGKQDW